MAKRRTNRKTTKASTHTSAPDKTHAHTSTKSEWSVESQPWFKPGMSEEDILKHMAKDLAKEEKAKKATETKPTDEAVETETITPESEEVAFYASWSPEEDDEIPEDRKTEDFEPWIKFLPESGLTPQLEHWKANLSSLTEEERLQYNIMCRGFEPDRGTRKLSTSIGKGGRVTTSSNQYSSDPVRRRKELEAVNKMRLRLSNWIKRGRRGPPPPTSVDLPKDLGAEDLRSSEMFFNATRHKYALWLIRAFSRAGLFVPGKCPDDFIGWARFDISQDKPFHEVSLSRFFDVLLVMRFKSIYLFCTSDPRGIVGMLQAKLIPLNCSVENRVQILDSNIPAIKFDLSIEFPDNIQCWTRIEHVDATPELKPIPASLVLKDRPWTETGLDLPDLFLAKFTGGIVPSA